MSAVVLAGGTSKRFGQHKGLVSLAEKPLLIHVLDRLTGIADDVAVVVSSTAQKNNFELVLKGRACIVMDDTDIQTPLAGTLAGLKSIQHNRSLLLACDSPFLSRQALNLLFDRCGTGSAAIPQWPNGNIEPLHAVYNARLTAQAAERALESGKLDMRSMIANMTSIHYVPTAAFRKFDPKLLTFFNINTPNDLKEAEQLLKSSANAIDQPTDASGENLSPRCETVDG